MAKYSFQELLEEVWKKVDFICYKAELRKQHATQNIQEFDRDARLCQELADIKKLIEDYLTELEKSPE